MAGARGDGSLAPGDLLDTSPSEIKLFLGTQAQEVTVNRAALQSLSPVFNSMLTHNMMERNQGQVRLEHVSLETWNVISAFYFSGEELVCLDNVEEIVRVADMYELKKLKAHCDAVLCKHAVWTDDPVATLAWASTFMLVNLIGMCLNVVRNDFVHLCQNESFLTLCKDQLLEIVRGPYLLGDELAVCLTVMRWLDAHNADGLIVEQLFQNLNLNEVCLCCLKKHVAKCESASLRGNVLRLVEAESQEREKGSPDRFPLQYLAYSDVNGVIRQIFPQQTGRPLGQRCTASGDDFILIDGDMANSDSLNVKAMNADGTLTDLSVIPAEWAINTNAACLFDDCLVLTGGWADCKTYFYDLKSQVWSTGPLLQEARTGHALVSSGDAMYAVMGMTLDGALSSIETYRKDEREWRVEGQMHSGVYCASAAMAGNYILAHGLTQGEQYTLQCFDTETKEVFFLTNTLLGHPLLPLFSCGPNGAVFASNGEFTFVRPSSGRQLSSLEGELPDLRGVYEGKKDSCADIEKPPGELQPSGWEHSISISQTPYLVQHDLFGKRANLKPLPPLIKFVHFFLRL